MTPRERTSQGLRDILFDEIDQLRSGNGDPKRALAVSNLARQIVNTAKAEMEFHRALTEGETDSAKLGTMKLGTSAVSAETSATAT